MAEQAEQEPVAAQAQGEDDECDETPGYKAPDYKSVDDIVKQDEDDESLVKYKKALLGETDYKPPCPDDKRNVILTKLSFLFKDRDNIELDLTQSLDTIKKTKIVLKEGVTYKVQISFYVQREIVSGLKYKQAVHRKGIKVSVDRSSHMVGSYGPSKDVKTCIVEQDEAPSGVIARGDYKVLSKFTDDDKNDILTWDWQFSIKKDWE